MFRRADVADPVWRHLIRTDVRNVTLARTKSIKEVDIEMMYGWHEWWPAMGLMWILPLLFLIVVVALVVRSPWRSRGERGVTRGETAREVLERRYASGEITKEQFEDMKRTLGY